MNNFIDALTEKAESDMSVNIIFRDAAGNSEKQLQELVWIVNGGNTDSTEKEDICYKLGAAKPLGLGSVKCSVSRVLERVVSLQDGTIQYKE